MMTNEPSGSPTNGAARLHLTITGRVQGVGFRYFVVETAENLGLKGWVRNTWDGKVELVAEGSRVDLELLRDRAAQGPPASLVTDIQESWDSATGQFTRFYVASSS
ncbi:MAG: acylphosphatase [Anaerolineaceae bacterium]